MTVALQVRGLGRRFGARWAIRDLDVTVQVGDVYGFLGPNGSGKTTAMRCMLGLIRPDTGDVTVFGSADPVARRRGVGAIIEVPAFHAWMSGRENLVQAAAYAGLLQHEADAAIARVLDRVGLTHRSADPAGTYSLGMKQRLGIARALLGGPRLLLLDEPTNGLDPHGVREVRELILSLAADDGLTVFVSSHQLAEVQQMCSRVGILREGRLRAEGRVTDLLGAGMAAAWELDADDRDALHAALLAAVGAVTPGRAGRLRVAPSDGAITPLIAAMLAQGHQLRAVVPVERDLEDVFVEVTR
jgi:ABC-2 type transport system ATP-binding protein